MFRSSLIQIFAVTLEHHYKPKKQEHANYNPLDVAMHINEAWEPADDILSDHQSSLHGNQQIR